MIVRRVNRDAAEPRAKRRRSAKASQRWEGSDHHLLGQILGMGPIGDGCRDAPELGSIGFAEIHERPIIPRLRTPQQLAFGLPVDHPGNLQHMRRGSREDP